MTTTYTTFTLPSEVDALPLTVYVWPAPEEPRATVQIAHGVAEHAGRYDRLARDLTTAGYAVYSHDHRGHGTSISESVPLGSFGAAGWSGLVADLAAVTQAIQAERPNLPLFLVGHSMGSFALQEVLLDHADLYAGAVLSGTTALDVLAAGMSASGEASNDLSAFNAGFTYRTGYEWLSRDETEVDQYVADPLSGFTLDEATIPALFGSAARLADPAVLAGIRSELPILLVSGDADPLAGGGQLIEIAGQRYRSAEIVDVTVRLFPGARHEIFNETNREEITAYVVDWLDDHSPTEGKPSR